MPRFIIVALAAILCGTCLAAEVDFEPYREAVGVLLADGATPDVELPEKLKKCGVPKDPAWPDLVGFRLTKKGSSERTTRTAPTRSCTAAS